MNKPCILIAIDHLSHAQMVNARRRKELVCIAISPMAAVGVKGFETSQPIVLILDDNELERKLVGKVLDKEFCELFLPRLLTMQ